MESKNRIDKKKLGFLGEEMAAEVLKGRGYYILRRNYTCPYGEVDIIAVKNNVLVFVEVKTKASRLYGNPAEAVDARKQRHIKNAARYFLSSAGKKYQNVDFQVMEISLYHIRGLEY